MPQLVAHWPAEQTSPLLQAAPQAPQWFGLLWVSTHSVPHLVAPPAHLMPHTPTEQTSPVLQAVPQAPQLFGSVPVSTHLSVQSVVPAHLASHLPCEQNSPVLQAVPQVPQLLGSKSVLVQVPLQSLSVPGQPAVSGRRRNRGAPRHPAGWSRIERNYCLSVQDSAAKPETIAFFRSPRLHHAPHGAT